MSGTDTPARTPMPTRTTAAPPTPMDASSVESTPAPTNAPTAEPNRAPPSASRGEPKRPTATRHQLGVEQHAGDPATGQTEYVHAHAHADVWLADVSVGYAERLVLERVSFAVEPGTLLAVVGPNGAGKSTLLRLIAGLLAPWAGRIEVLGAPPGREAHRVAYVPQAELVDWDFPVSVHQVVMMGRYPTLGPLRAPGPDDRRAVAAALERVGMRDQTGTQIGALSGGQRRRVFLARALAADPALFLLDEPVTGIDATTEEDLMAILDAEAARGKTVIATTHDLAAAAQQFHRVLAINRTIVAYGPSELVLDREVLSRIYGGRVLVLGGQTVLLDDAHHHDQPAPGEEHHHIERSEGP